MADGGVPIARTSPAKRRRLAKHAFDRAGKLVQRELGLDVWPRPARRSARPVFRHGQWTLRRAGAEQRLHGRPVAMHVAMEAADLRAGDVAAAAGVARGSADYAQRAIWERRDADPQFNSVCERMIESLRVALKATMRGKLQ